MADTILVVEDTELLRRIYTDKLSGDGYEVVQAADGLEALNALRTHKIDLILLDLIRPKMSGLEALEAIKADPRTRDIPVLILSNLGQEQAVQHGLSLGAIDYLIKNEAKPADVAEKIALTLEHMSGRQTQTVSYKLHLKDHDADADRFIADARLAARFWCPACQVELQLEMIPKADKPGWYDSHLLCPLCGKEY